MRGIISSCGHERHKHVTLLIDTLQGLAQQPDQRDSSRMVQSHWPAVHVSNLSPLPLEWRKESTHADMSTTSMALPLIHPLQGLESQPDQRISSRMAQSDETAVHVSTFSPLSLEWRKEITSSCGHERHKHGTSLIDSYAGTWAIIRSAGLFHTGVD
jgi:hypothetical protein